MSWTLSAMAQDSGDKLTELLALKETTAVNNRLAELGKGEEADLNIVLRYFNVKRDFKRSDSVQKVLVKRYPYGEVSFELFRDKFLREMDLGKKEVMYGDGIANFPKESADLLNQSMAESYISADKIKNASKYISNITSAESIASVAEKLASKYPSAAEDLLKNRIEKGRLSGKEINPMVNQYSLLLTKMDRYTEALKYADEAYPKLRYKSEVNTANYVKLLMHAKRYEDVMATLEPLVKKGKANEHLKKELQSAYGLANPTLNPSSYMEGLNKIYMEYLEAELAKKMIAIAAPTFLGKDINGKEVTIDQYRGKVVIIDFWATWCVPCKASFPAMQSAVNKFSNDPNVAFLFLHTFETTPNPLKDASDYLKDKGYNFTLLMDHKDTSTKKNIVAGSFGVASIPTKLIIDGNGKIRFSTSGYYANDKAVVDEISTMIGLAKKTKTEF
ncbi:TlpA family protein disulfide reductase [Pedobacter sp. MW01-1-1]|uniref:TlpA family protein disulfide reductase n=1 Tax=Pedobacter sp. MW01-1-1 TaxID=3383027 RepID=UPI003FEF0F87